MEAFIQFLYRALFGLEVKFMTDLERLQQREDDLLQTQDSIASELAAIRREIDAHLVAKTQEGNAA